MNEKPLITVVVPIYNVEVYLEQCIRSVLAQTYENFELLLVDDGSKDKSGEIVDRLAQTDRRIVPFHQKNQGVAAARNTGLDHSKGRYAAFLDGDDWYHPDFLEKMEAALEAGDGQLASCCFEAVGVEHPPQVKTLKAAVVDRREAMQLLMGYNSFNGYIWNKLFDLQLIRENDIRFHADYPACGTPCLWEAISTIAAGSASQRNACTATVRSAAAQTEAGIPAGRRMTRNG